jgi:hypothetical protein
MGLPGGIGLGRRRKRLRRRLPAGAAVVPRIVGDTPLVGAIGIHHHDLHVAEALSVEGDLLTVRRPIGILLAGRGTEGDPRSFVSL